MSKLSEPSLAKLTPTEPEYSREERRLLLRIAHEAILSTFGKAGRPEVGASAGSSAEVSAHLSEPRGVFTTLYLDHALRGCVGYAQPIAPLYSAVADSARAAAFEDTRFWPVTEAEAAELEISLSVLSLLSPIHPEEVEVGRHGLVISDGQRRGLLLPQVPVEHAWDRETFLEQTCRKAGLALDAWRGRAMLEAFTAEVFGDADTPRT